MNKVRLGIIGFGYIGTFHSENILAGKIPDIELTAIADLSEGRRVWAKEHLPASVGVFEREEDLIASGKCDAVLVAMPHYMHPQCVIAALEKGLHVICEKPLGVYTKQVRPMLEAVKPGQVFAVMLNQRTDPLYRKVKELVGSGKYGRMRRVTWIMTDWYRPQIYFDGGAWRATWAGEGGGVLLNQCVHNIDLLQWICGMPTLVRAFCHNGKWHDIEVEDDVTAYMEFAGGATGTLITSTGDAPGTNRLEIVMDGGKMVCENRELTMYELDVSEPEYRMSATDSYAVPPHRARNIDVSGENLQHVGVLRAFAAHILRGEPLVAQGREGLNCVMLTNAMYLSSWLGESVRIPIDEDLFLEKLDALRNK